MALIGFRSPLTYHPWPWSEYTEAQKGAFVAGYFIRIGLRSASAAYGDVSVGYREAA